jgi:hypothetical protein
MSASTPCRLMVYLARDVPMGVVLRRGPSAWSRLSLWHTDTDTFEHGQWFRGRVYERRCDLSQDGSMFVYFARKSSARPPRDSWIAISRPPHFTALALWFWGTTYCIGAYFPDLGAMWPLADGPPDQGELPSWLTTPATEELAPYYDHTVTWTDRTIFLNRLLRDGWRPVGEVASAETWEHTSPDRRQTLLMSQRLGLMGFDDTWHDLVTYGVRDEPDGETHTIGRAAWGDWDHRGRMVLARDGRLVHWQSPDTIIDIEDFNPQTPMPEPAPRWASRWPERPKGVKSAPKTQPKRRTKA